MAQNDGVELNFDMNANTGPMLEGMQRVAAVTKQIRADIEAMSDGLDGTIDRANKLRTSFEGSLNLVDQIKAGMDVVGTFAQTFQTAQNNNTNALLEMMRSTRALGGNMNQFMNIASSAGFGRGTPGYGGVYTGGITQSQDFSSYAQDQESNISSSPYDRIIKRRAKPASGGGAGGGIPPIFTSGGEVPYEEVPYNGQGPNTDAINGIYGTRGINLGGNRQVPIKPAQLMIQDQLKQYYPNLYDDIVGNGKEGTAAEFAYRNMMYQAGSLIGRIPGGGRIMGRLQEGLNNYGINLDAIKASQRSNTIPTGNVDEYGNPTYTRPFGIPNAGASGGIADAGAEAVTLRIANQVSKIFDSSVAQNFAKYAGFAGAAGSVYGTLSDVAGQARQLTGFAQAQGNALGMVNYGQSAGLFGQAFLNSWGGLNPFFSTQQSMQAQMNGAALGLRGANLSNYANQAMTAQTKFGMGGQQFQSIMGAGLGVGVNVNQNMQGLGQIRQLEANTQTSTAYGNQAYVAGMQSNAGMGVSPTVAVQMGIQAAKFGSGNLIAQSYGMTGQEGQGTTLNNALMAQQLGTSYTGLYAAEQKVGAAGQAKAQNSTDEEILSWSGIDITATYKDENDFKAKNGDKIMTLQAMLQSGQVGQKLANVASTPQSTETWAWSVVRQHQKLNQKTKNSPPGSGLARIFGDVSHAVEHAVGGTLKTAGNALEAAQHVATDVGLSPEWLVSQSGYSHDTNSINRNFDSSVTATGDLIKGAASSAIKIAGSSALDLSQPKNIAHSVEVTFKGAAERLFNSTIKQATAGNNNGSLPPNKQPTQSLPF